MRNRIRLTESELTRLIKRVISEQSGPKECDDRDFKVMSDVLLKTDDLTLNFNTLHDNIVEVKSNAAKLHCWCKKVHFRAWAQSGV